LGQYLAKKQDPRLRLWRETPRGEKLVRAMKVLPAVEKGIALVSVAGANGWVAPYLNEFMCFPHGANDDQVDSLVQLLMRREVQNLLHPESAPRIYFC